MSGAGRRVGAEFEFDFDANVHRSNPLKARGRSRRWAIGIVRHAQNFKLRAHSSTYPVYGARLPRTAERHPPPFVVVCHCTVHSTAFQGNLRTAAKIPPAKG